MRYIFGPVPSRRLGRSLGIDPTPPPRLAEATMARQCPGPSASKTCNWNCVYCQLGRTRPFTRKRASLFPPMELLSELRDTLSASPPGAIDWITFVGSGEPTLNRDLGTLVRGAKALSDIPVAVITNGSLLGEPEVAEALLLADAVMPTLDTGNPDLFRRINRPPSELSLENHIRGLAAFRRQYKGRLWIEVMLLSGLNDGEEALRDLADALESVGPDAVHILLPTRPPAEANVLPADEAGLARARQILGGKAHVLMPDERRGGFSLDGASDAFLAARSILARHPLSEEELLEALRDAGIADSQAAIASLLQSGKIIRVQRYGRTFIRCGHD